MAELERQHRWQVARTSAVEHGDLAGLAIPAGVTAEGGATLALRQELAIDDPAYRAMAGVLTLAGERVGVPVELDLNPYARPRVELGLRPTRALAFGHRRRERAYMAAAREVLDCLAERLAERATPQVDQAA